MNTEDFCTYEQALALKKLGFDERCLFHYIGDKSSLTENALWWNGIVSVDRLYKSYNKCRVCDCDAPTLAQAQKWLRNEKKFSVEVSSLCITSWFYDIDNLKDNKSFETYGVYKSYEEALSAGITECLKLLEKDG